MKASSSKYNLTVRSQNKTYRTHQIEGMDTIGVDRDVPFEINFQNNSSGPVEIVLAVDGRNVLTNEPAKSTDTKRFLVRSYEPLKLSAWPETNEGGAQFVFSSIDRSVAANTGNGQGLPGFISVLVFKESRPVSSFRSRGTLSGTLGGQYLSKGITTRSTMSHEGEFGAEIGMSKGCLGLGAGAGDYQEQSLSKVKGITDPVIDQQLQIRYLPANVVERAIQVGPFGIEMVAETNYSLSSVPRASTTLVPSFPGQFV